VLLSLAAVTLLMVLVLTYTSLAFREAKEASADSSTGSNLQRVLCELGQLGEKEIFGPQRRIFTFGAYTIEIFSR
jgi:hypothetical protein